MVNFYFERAKGLTVKEEYDDYNETLNSYDVKS